MPNQQIIGIDIGGTKIHMGIVQDGRIIQELKLSTPADASSKEIIDQIITGIEQLMKPEVLGIGIGMPGLVDEEEGIVFDVQNIPAWKEVPLKKQLEGYFNKPVYMTNDANTFILGEKMFGRAQAFKNVVGITLGTGLGAGIIINNAPYAGTLSSAGEFGGIPYLDKTIEDYCSGKFFLNQFGVAGDKLYELAEGGDEKALDVFNRLGHHIGEAIKIVLFTLSPEAIFLGGSVSGCYKFFREAMEKNIQTFPFRRVTEKLVIETSAIENAAVLGAVALFRMKNSDKKAALKALDER